MANTRNPPDPDKTKPYWHTDRLPQKSKPSKRRSPVKPQLEPGKRVDGSDFDGAA
jgi:hypothetical protein